MVVLALVSCAALVAASQSMAPKTDCPTGTVVVGHVTGGVVCEDFTKINGSITFPSGVVLNKRMCVLHGCMTTAGCAGHCMTTAAWLHDHCWPLHSGLCSHLQGDCCMKTACCLPHAGLCCMVKCCMTSA